MRSTHSLPRLRRPRALAAIATLAIAVGAGLVITDAAPADAHTGDMQAVAVCNPSTGQYDVTYTLTLSQAAGKAGETKWRIGGQDFAGTPSSAAGMDRGPIASSGNATLTLGTESLDGSTVGNGSWVYAYTQWSDGYGRGSDTRVEGLQGDCSVPIPTKPEPYTGASEWGAWDADCETETAIRGRTTWTIDWRWDESTLTWIDDVRSEDTTETETRTVTLQECPLPELPEDEIVVGTWTTPEITCDSKAGEELPIERTVTTTTYSRDEDGNPVPASSTRTEEDVHVVTQAEVDELSCPVPPTETPTPTDTHTPSEEPTPAAVQAADLAQTGGETSPVLPITGVLLLAAAVALLLLPRALRR